MYCILEGKVSLRVQDEGRHPIELGVRQEGDTVGELALIDGGPRSATVTTLEPCRLFAIERRRFLEVLTKSPNLLANLLVVLTGKIRTETARFSEAALDQEKLKTQQEVARRRSMSQMVAGVAHEINTPLGIANHAASIISDLLSTFAVEVEQTLTKREAVQDVLEACRLMQDNIRRADRLVQTFKTLAVNQAVDNIEAVGLRRLTQDVVELFSLTARSSRLAIRVVDELGPGSDRWEGYPGHYTQVLLNLLTNIDRYAYPDGTGGKVEIVLGVLDRSGSDGRYSVVVRDFGRGIAPEHLEHVFEPVLHDRADDWGYGSGPRDRQEPGDGILAGGDPHRVSPRRGHRGIPKSAARCGPARIDGPMTDHYDSADALATIPHTGVLEDLTETPRFLLPASAPRQPHLGWYSCSFCGVGDSGSIASSEMPSTEISALGSGVLRVTIEGSVKEFPACVEGGRLHVDGECALTPPGGVLQGELIIDSKTLPIAARESHREYTPTGRLASIDFDLFRSALSVAETRVIETVPTPGCMKLQLSLGRQRPAFPIHTAPSILEGPSAGRRNIAYREAIARFADLLLAHRRGRGRTLIYACGQIDYFAIFAIQEVFRLLGVRNLTGNAEHCLNAGAVHNEILTGQEGPFVTVAQALEGRDRFYLFNGWNGFITHPPVFRALLKREELDAYLIEVMETESARALAHRLGPDRVLLIRPRTDPHLALAVAHEILHQYPGAVDHRFVSHFSTQESFKTFSALAACERFDPIRVAARIAPEPELAVRIVKGIRRIAFKVASPLSCPSTYPRWGCHRRAAWSRTASGAVCLRCSASMVSVPRGAWPAAPSASPGRSMPRPRSRACRASISWVVYRSRWRPRPRSAWGCRKTRIRPCWRMCRARPWTTPIRPRSPSYSSAWARSSKPT